MFDKRTVTQEVEKTISEIHEVFLKYVYEYIQTGIFNNKHSGSYMKAYTLVCSLEDASSMFSIKEYVRETMNNYVLSRIGAILGLEDEEFIKEVGDFLSKAKILQYWIYKIYYKLVVL